MLGSVVDLAKKSDISFVVKFMHHIISFRAYIFPGQFKWKLHSCYAVDIEETHNFYRMSSDCIVSKKIYIAFTECL